MVVLTARSVLKKKQLDDNALIEIKLKLARKLFEKSFDKKRIYKVMTFLNSYIHFENKENSIIFEHHLDQIKGRRATMGIEELVLRAREHEGIKIGEKRGEKRGSERRTLEIVTNMLSKNLSDSMIADITGVSLEYIQKVKSDLLKNNIDK